MSTLRLEWRMATYPLASPTLDIAEGPVPLDVVRYDIVYAWDYDEQLSPRQGVVRSETGARYYVQRDEAGEVTGQVMA